MKTLIQELEQQTVQELTQVANKYPYVAIYRMVLAKKLKQDGSTKAFNQALAKASLRVPSRIVLKEYLEKELYSTEIVTTEKNKAIFQATSSEEAKEEIKQEETFTAEPTATALVSATVAATAATLSNEENTKSIDDENAIEHQADSNQENEPTTETVQKDDSKFDFSAIQDEEGEEIEVEIIQEEINENQEIKNQAIYAKTDSTSTLNKDEFNTDNELDKSERKEENIEVEIYEIKDTEQAIHISESDDLNDAQETESEEDSIEVEISQLDEDLTLQYTNDSNVETSNEVDDTHFSQSTQQQEKDQEESNELLENEDESTQKGLTIDEFQETLNVKQKDALFHYHGFDDDEIERIGNELIHEEEAREQLKLDNDQRVEDLKVGENDSVYKKVVEILKQDSYNFSAQESTNHIISSSDIVEESLEDIHNDIEPEEELSVEKIEQNEEIQDLNEKLDEELDLLYAQSSYESSLEYEIQEMQKQDEAKQIIKEEEPIQEKEQSIQIQNKVEQPQESSLPRKDSHSFFAWLNKFSAQKQENKAIEEKQSVNNKITKQEESQAQALTNDAPKTIHQEEVKPKIDFKQEEVDNQYRDSDDDLDDEITKEVQEKAKKSMTENRSYYTETLAYIYELQDKWEKAIEVYQELILKNPEKSAYFASQIKLLREKIETE